MHTCEACNKTGDLTPEEAFSEGWDYPPNIGTFGVVSPRTCGDCSIEKTLWWALSVNRTPFEELAENHQKTLQKILAETQ